MPCYKPNPVVILGDRYMPLSNHGVKNGILFCGRNTDFVVLYDKLLRKVVQIPKTEFSYVDCGQCYGCRFKQSVEKANRCTLEIACHDSSYFLTLTYDDKHLPIGKYGIPTLKRKDLQKFIKDLRRQLDYRGLDDKDNPVKILQAGEYGDKFHRPHYHLIVCGLVIPDLVLFSTNFEGDVYYTSEWLSRIWKKGYVLVGEANWNSAAYVSRYVVKKHKGKEKHIYSDLGIEEEFDRCSNHMGGKYYELHKNDIYATDNIIVPDLKKGYREFKPPKTFDAWFEAESPEDFEKLKAKRMEKAKASMELILSQTDLDLYDYLAVKEQNFRAKTKALHRK